MIARRKLTALLAALALTASVGVYAQQVPFEQFVWGFCQVGGTHRAAEWPLSRDQMLILRDELHVNTIRFFVHPGFVGLPQKTWNGPEAMDYTRFSDADYVWRDPSPAIDSLDEVIDLFRELDIHPVLLVFPVDEYVAYISRDDLTFLNNPEKGLDYTGIRPVEQVKALTVALARHMHETYGDDFTLVYTEVAGAGDGAPGRTGDRQCWANIVAAAKAEAPGATICSPELCVSMWWWSAALHRLSNPPTPPERLPLDFPYTEGWPRGDRLENYRDVFDVMAISYYGFGEDAVEWKDVASDRPAVAAAAEAVTWLTRPLARPKRWLWAEAGWGAPVKERPAYHLERDLAMLLLGMDHCAGALLWQARNNEGSTGGVFDENGDRGKGFELVKAVSDVVLANAAFFATDHDTVNPDSFPVATGAFSEGDPAILTRYVGNHVVLFSEAPVQGALTFANTGGRGLQEIPVGHGYSSPWTLAIERQAETVTVRKIRPGLLYLLEVTP